MCCGASLALLLAGMVISIWNSARGAVRNPLVQALPVARRRQTTREIRLYVAGGPPPTVDVGTARAGAFLLVLAGAAYLARDVRPAEAFLDRHPGP